jgi:hypothetical protein
VSAKPTQRGRCSPPPADEALARRYWRFAVIRGGCVMCKAYPLSRQQRAGREADIQRVEGHHVLAKRYLKARGLANRFWDTRNGLGLCSYHHARHERWMQRVPYELVPDDAIEFADEVGLLHLIEHDYPEGA